MSKLIFSAFSRLKRDKVFWTALVCVLAFSAVSILNSCRHYDPEIISELNNLDHHYFNIIPMLAIVFAVFTSLFLGTEYSDGVIRNKIISGHTRANIYISNLIATFAASVCLLIASLTGGLAGIPTFGWLKMGSGQLALYLAICVLLTASLSAIFTFIGMLISNKAASAVISILLAIGLILIASVIYNALCEPEMTGGAIITMEGIQMQEPHPNPRYIGGLLRKIYQFVIDFLPTGQGIQMTNLEIGHPVQMIVYSLLITFGMSAGGISVFRKKNLK